MDPNEFSGNFAFSISQLCLFYKSWDTTTPDAHEATSTVCQRQSELGLKLAERTAGRM